MMNTASLMWAGAAEKSKQPKVVLRNLQNDSKQLNWLKMTWNPQNCTGSSSSGGGKSDIGSSDCGSSVDGEVVVAGACRGMYTLYGV